MNICHVILLVWLVSADSESEFMFYSAGLCPPPITQTGQEDVLWIAKHGRAIIHHLT